MSYSKLMITTCLVGILLPHVHGSQSTPGQQSDSRLKSRQILFDVAEQAKSGPGREALRQTLNAHLSLYPQDAGELFPDYRGIPRITLDPNQPNKTRIYEFHTFSAIKLSLNQARGITGPNEKETIPQGTSERLTCSLNGYYEVQPCNDFHTYFGRGRFLKNKEHKRIGYRLSSRNGEPAGPIVKNFASWLFDYNYTPGSRKEVNQLRKNSGMDALPDQVVHAKEFWRIDGAFYHVSELPQVPVVGEKWYKTDTPNTKPTPNIPACKAPGNDHIQGLMQRLESPTFSTTDEAASTESRTPSTRGKSQKTMWSTGGSPKNLADIMKELVQNGPTDL